MNMDRPVAPTDPAPGGPWPRRAAGRILASAAAAATAPGPVEVRCEPVPPRTRLPDWVRRRPPAGDGWDREEARAPR